MLDAEVNADGGGGGVRVERVVEVAEEDYGGGEER